MIRSTLWNTKHQAPSIRRKTHFLLLYIATPSLPFLAAPLVTLVSHHPLPRKSFTPLHNNIYLSILPQHISTFPTMSRVTPIPPPVKRVFLQSVRRISSSSSSAHPSPLMGSASRINVYLPRAHKDLKAECLKRNLRPSGNKSEVSVPPLLSAPAINKSLAC